METKICPQCGGNIINKKGTSKKTGKPYHEFTVCRVCNTPQRPEGGLQKAVDETSNQVISAEVIERLAKIEKKLEQVIYLITGVSAENNKEEFAEIMKECFGRGLLKK